MHNFTSNFTMQRKCFKPSTFPEIDQELYQWFLRMRANKVELSSDLLIHQAKSIAASENVDNFKASKGYIEGFKSRYNIVFKKLHGEGAAVNTEVFDDWFAKILHLIADYSPNDTFNWDETALFYTETRNASLVTAEKKKDRNLWGSKQQKQRITVLVGASKSGEKLPFIVVGKYEKPRVFKNARAPVEYHAQKRAWMTASLFEQILVKLDRSMGYKNRQVLLFVDNCSAHPKIQTKNIRLVFSPRMLLRAVSLRIWVSFIR